MNIDGHEYTDFEIRNAIERSMDSRWTDSAFGSWADRQYQVFNMAKFRSELRVIAAANAPPKEEHA